VSIDLVRGAEYESCTVFFWAELLKLARLYGWKPAGTLPAEAADPDEAAAWDGNYVLNGNQRVTDADACALADALERSLPDLPDAYAAGHKAIIEGPEDRPTNVLVPVGAPISPIEAMSGPNKDALRDYIAFFRKGGFEIQ
jgi:hypothetical protein